MGRKQKGGRLEAGCWKRDAGGGMPEAGCGKLEVEGRKLRFRRAGQKLLALRLQPYALSPTP
jgi:hypothetical protein